MRKLTVGTENMQLLEVLRTKCFQCHEKYWPKEAFILSVIMDSRQRFHTLEVKIKLSAIPLEDIALSVISFFLFAGATSTKNCTEHCCHKSAPLEWGATCSPSLIPTFVESLIITLTYDEKIMRESLLCQHVDVFYLLVMKHVSMCRCFLCFLMVEHERIRISSWSG